MKWKRVFRLIGWGSAASFILLGVFGPRDEKNPWFLLLWAISLIGILISVAGEYLASHEIVERVDSI